jgi:hypothetical protein
MSRGKLAIVALVTILAVSAQAGEIKTHQWPATFVPQEIATINVVMDIGYWVQIVNQFDVIKLKQVSVHTYEGCIDLKVKCNFNVALSASIAPTGAVAGTYSCTIDNPMVDAPGGVAALCARLTNANIGGQPGGSKNVHVAVITVKVVPR